MVRGETSNRSANSCAPMRFLSRSIIIMLTSLSIFMGYLPFKISFSNGAVAAIMALDRAVKNSGSTGSVYGERGILSF